MTSVATAAEPVAALLPPLGLTRGAQGSLLGEFPVGIAAVLSWAFIWSGDAMGLSVMNFQQLGEQMIAILQGPAQRKMPADWSLCQCEYNRNEWLHISTSARAVLNAMDLSQVKQVLESLPCPHHTSGGYFHAREKYAFASTPEMVAYAWMPEYRATLADTCVVGHLVLMLLCSQRFLLAAGNGDQAALQSFFVHMQGIASILQLGTGDGMHEKENAHILDVTRCLRSSVFPVDGTRLRAYATQWLGEAFTSPRAAYAGGNPDVAGSIPFKERPCVPLANLQCFPRTASFASESCTHCCGALSHDASCFDAVWTFERCCQRDFDGLHCEEVRHGEERGEVAELVDFKCLPIEEHEADVAEKRLRTARDAVPKQESAIKQAEVALVEARQLHEQAIAAFEAASQRATKAVAALTLRIGEEDIAAEALDQANMKEVTKKEERKRAEEAVMAPRSLAAEIAEAERRHSEAVAEAQAKARATADRHAVARRARATEGRTQCHSDAQSAARASALELVAAERAAEAAVAEAATKATAALAAETDAKQELADADWSLELARRLEKTIRGQTSWLAVLKRALALARRVGRSFGLIRVEGDAAEATVASSRRVADALTARGLAEDRLQAVKAQAAEAEATRVSAVAAREVVSRQRHEAPQRAAELAMEQCEAELAPEAPQEVADRHASERAVAEANKLLAEATRRRMDADVDLRRHEDALAHAKAEEAAAAAAVSKAAEVLKQAKERRAAAKKESEMAEQAKQKAKKQEEKRGKEISLKERELQEARNRLKETIAAIPGAEAALAAAVDIRAHARLYGGRNANVTAGPAGAETVGVKDLLHHSEL